MESSAVQHYNHLKINLFFMDKRLNWRLPKR